MINIYNLVPDENEEGNRHYSRWVIRMILDSDKLTGQ